MTDEQHTPDVPTTTPTAPAAPAAPFAATTAPSAGGTAVATAPAQRGTPARGGWWLGTGRRKSSVARVRIRPGEGKFVVNKRPYEEFFNHERDRCDLMNVLEKTRTKGSVDVHVTVHGGGFTGQAGAILLGLARALNRFDPSLDPILRDNNFLTRDPREVERKKYGQAGARARFQFSKR